MLSSLPAEAEPAGHQAPMSPKDAAQSSAAVVIEYEQLLAVHPSLTAAIERAFGSHDDALGVILVRRVPDYQRLRAALLPLASDLARLPPATLRALEDADSQYMFGWSHGREVMDGKPDYAKGSFYANPTYDVPTEDPALKQRYAEYCHPNLWPEEHLPALRPAFRELGQLMVDVGALVARECDTLLTSLDTGLPRNFLEDMVRCSRSNKGRLLHYFPTDGATSDSSSSTWCGWHLDHSCLTALTAPMYLDESLGNDTSTMPTADFGGGLYVRNRRGNVVHVSIPEDCVAFQTGEALQVASRNKLMATPHYVQAVGASKAKIARNTLAVFIQPDWQQDVAPGYPFTQFTKDVLKRHYTD